MAINFVTRDGKKSKSKHDLDTNTALERIYKQPQMVKIKKVDELRESKKASGSYYFFVDLEFESGETFGVSYTVNPDEYGEIWVSNGSKLFALLKGILNIDEFEYKGFTLTKEDVDETLFGQEFMAKGVVRTIGGDNYIYLTSEKVEV